MTDDMAPPAPTATAAPPPPSAGVRWGGYLVLLALLLGIGLLLSWRPLRPAFLVPEWLWWYFSGAYGVGFFATAVVLASGMAQDAADLMLVRGWRVLARATILLMIVALAGLAVWAWRHGHHVTAVIAALMGTVGPLARRALPGLPRAQARYKS